METIHGAPSYVLRTPEVDLAVTQTAGHLAPVRFYLGTLTAAPYSLSPWTPAQIDQGLPNLLLYLRGDFLCLPFGGQENGPPHGDVANANWSLVEQTSTQLTLRQTGADTGATVTKTLSLIPGHHAVYAEHRIENLEGVWNYGNHPVLDLSAVPLAPPGSPPAPSGSAPSTRASFLTPRTASPARCAPTPASATSRRYRPNPVTTRT